MQIVALQKVELIAGKDKFIKVSLNVYYPGKAAVLLN